MSEPSEPRLRVGLASGRERAVLSLRGDFRLGEGTVAAAERLEVVAEPGLVRLLRPDGSEIARGVELRLEPLEDDGAFTLHDMTVGVAFHWQHEQDLTFRGACSLESRGAKFDVIDEVGLETYLESVISSEMSARCPPALLRAHAVISRSWLLAQLEGRDDDPPRPPGVTQEGDVTRIVRWYDREDHAHFDVCADDHCQRYQGITRTFTDEAVAAVRDTRGVVLVSGKRTCDARFSKSCGGMTEVFSAAWADVDVPYLQAFADDDQPAQFALPLTDEANAEAFIRGAPPAFCNHADKELLQKLLPELDHATADDFYRWEERVTAAQIREYVRQKVEIELGTVQALVPVARGPSGRLVALRIEGSEATLEVGKELEIRRLLSKTHLYSSAIVVTATEGEGEDRVFVLRGAGWGHGVGLCQIGAAVMADRGYDHEGILAHYYRGAGLERRY
ncbi:MAG: SpoIID/LytB domain-containing protein [Myxococcota bacterium]